jgi:putative aminopeptidase FrvX
MKELLEELIKVPGVTGFEDDIRENIAAKLKKMGLKPKEDNIGNLFVTVGDKGPLIVFIAHMDELGLIVSNIDSDGSIRIRKVGGIDDRSLVGRVVEIKTQKGIVRGVIGLKPPHLMTDREEMKKVVRWEDIRIDVGTRSRKETAKLGVRVLDPMVIKKDVTYLSDDLVCARGIDDRAGCAVLLEALEELKDAGLPLRIAFVWSVQEETGLRGATVIGFSMRPDYVFAVDTMTTTDAPMMGDTFEKVLIGGGPAMRMYDDSAVASPKLRKLIEEVARKSKIPLQYGTGGGGTDGAAIQEFGALMMPIGIPMRYTHSPTEVASIKDMDNSVKLLVGVAERIAKGSKKGR